MSFSFSYTRKIGIHEFQFLLHQEDWYPRVSVFSFLFRYLQYDLVGPWALLLKDQEKATRLLSGN